MSFYKSVKHRVVMWTWNHTPHCDEMTHLASQSLELPLSPWTRMKVRLHFFICAWCRRYFEQLKLLHQAGSCLDDHRDAAARKGLSADAKQRMLQQLRNAENK